MDNFNKWYGIALISLFIAMGVSLSIYEYSKHLTAKSAMENGYEQKKNDFGKAIWVKIEKE